MLSYPNEKHTTHSEVLPSILHQQTEDEHHVESETPQENEHLTETNPNPLVCKQLRFYFIFTFFIIYF